MKNKTFILLVLTIVFMLSACGGRKGVRVTEGTETIGSAPAGTLFATQEASIVHVDLSGRVATVRNGGKFKTGAFLIVKDNVDGEQTGLLKARAKRPTGLRTADVLEGEPTINDLVTRASAAESERLSKIYREPEQ